MVVVDLGIVLGIFGAIACAYGAIFGVYRWTASHTDKFMTEVRDAMKASDRADAERCKDLGAKMDKLSDAFVDHRARVETALGLKPQRRDGGAIHDTDEG